MSVFLKIFTVAENAAAAVAFIGYAWMLSFPFTITHSQDRLLHQVLSATCVAVLVAWACGLGSFAFLKLTSNRQSRVGASVKCWAYVSMFITLAATLVLLTYGRVGDVAGPPSS
jgi:hypothetical protein